MRLIKNISLILLLAVVSSCIKPYDPKINSNIAKKYVVIGRVTDHEGWQRVKISLSSPIDNPEDIPVEGCQVEIHDDLGNVFTMEDYGSGSYLVWMDQQYLNPGTSYYVVIHAPDGSELTSTPDRMQEVPPVDSVYYELVDVPTNDPAVYNRGMQFYLDLNGEGYNCRYYKWEIAETWEYHSAHALEYYYDGNFHHVYPPDSSNYTCWLSGVFPKLFTLSTESFSANSVQKFPLHFIDGSTSRLSVLYSILVKQYALSEEAYNYWDQMRVNSEQQGGLYEKQPLAIKGNIVNVTHPDRDVLGFFYAVSESDKRYFYKDIPGLELDYYDYCSDDTLGRMGFAEFVPSDYPVYYYYNEHHFIRILSHECVNCRSRGGTTVKPDFWP